MDTIYLNGVSSDIHENIKCSNIEKQIRNVLHEMDEIEKLDNNRDRIKSKIYQIYDLSIQLDDCKKN